MRECAKEVLEALFDGQAPVSTSAVAAAGRVQGFGSDYVPSETSGKASGTTGAYFSSVVNSLQSSVLGDGTDARYAGHPGATSSFGPSGAGGNSFGSAGNTGGSSGGFGNPNFQDPRNEKSWLERASQMAGFSKTDTREPLQSSGGGFSGSNTHSSGTFNRAAFSNNPGPVTNSGYSYATNRGPNGIHSAASPYAPSGPYGQSSAPAGNNGIVPEMPANVSGYGRAGGAMSTGEYEKNIITSLCEPGGLRPVPAEDKLVELLNSASTLSEDILGNCLLDMLNDEAWQSRTKALIVVARLVKVPDCTTHARWWAQHADVVESLQSDPKAGVRTQAVKTLKAIDPSASWAAGAPTEGTAPRRVSSGRAWTGTGAAEEAQTGGVVEQQGKRELNLLDMDDLAPAVSVSAPVPSSTMPSTAPYGPPSVSSGMSPLSQDDGLDLFGPGMTLSTASTPSAMTSPPVQPQYTQPSPAFGGVAMTPMAPHSAPTSVSAGMYDTDSMFAGMSVGSAPSVAPAPAPVPAATAFDFLNTGTTPPPAVNQNANINLFGSLTLADHTVPAPAPVPVSVHNHNQVQAGGNLSGLLDLSAPSNKNNNNNSVPAANGLPAMTPQQHQQFMQYQQFLLHQQQQQQQQGQGQPQSQFPPSPQLGPAGAGHPNNNIGMYLTRPVPGMNAGPSTAPAPHGHPAYGQSNHHNMMYPPNGPGPVPGAPRGSPHQPSIQVRQGASVIAPGMLSHTAERKNIPVAGAAGELCASMLQVCVLFPPYQYSFPVFFRVIHQYLRAFSLFLTFAAGSSSAFGFMGGQQPPQQSGKPAGGIDSFSFVTDAMRSQK